MNLKREIYCRLLMLLRLRLSMLLRFLRVYIYISITSAIFPIFVFFWQSCLDFLNCTFLIPVPLTYFFPNTWHSYHFIQIILFYKSFIVHTGNAAASLWVSQSAQVFVCGSVCMCVCEWVDSKCEQGCCNSFSFATSLWLHRHNRERAH